MCCRVPGHSAFKSYCDKCSTPTCEKCFPEHNEHRTYLILLSDATNDIRIEMERTEKWLQEKELETTNLVEEVPKYLKEFNAIRDKIKNSSSNQGDNFFLETARFLHSQLQERLSNFDTECEEREKFRTNVKQILQELKVLGKVMCPLTFLPIFLHINNTIDSWKGSFTSAVPLSLKVEIKDAFNLGRLFDCLITGGNVCGPQKQNDDIDSQMASILERVTINERDTDERPKDKDSYDKAIEYLKKENERLATTEKETYDNMKKLKEKLTSMETKTKADKTRYTENMEHLKHQLREKVASYKALKEEFVDNQNRYTENMEQLKQQLKEKESLLLSLTVEKDASFKALREEFVDNQNRYAEEIDALKSKVESLNKRNYELDKLTNYNMKKLEEQREILNNEKKGFQNRQTEKDEHLLEKKINELQLTNESFTKMNEELNKHIQNIEREKTELQDRLNGSVANIERKLEESMAREARSSEEIHHRDIDMEVLKTEKDGLQNRYDDCLKQCKDKYETEKKQLINDAMKKKHDALALHRKENAELKNSYDVYIKNLQQQLQNEKQHLLSIIKERDDALSALRKEKDDLQNRLSSIAGERLTKGNPAITDLGDPNRPMKIGEKYGELYDNEWTDAIECTGDLKQLHTDLKSSEIEEIVIHHLYKILTQCYQECLKLSNDQLLNVVQMIQLDTSKVETDIESLPGCKEVLEIRRQHAEKFAKELYQNKLLVDKIVSSDWQYPRKSDDLMRRLMKTSFYEKCVHLCWIMAIQNPVMVLSEDLPPGTVYDKNVFKEFVQSGNKVQYVVWPALYLYTNGPLLFKGVVQACK